MTAGSSPEVSIDIRPGNDCTSQSRALLSVMFSRVNSSTVFETCFTRSMNACICLIVLPMMASNVPLIRSATKVGKAMARSVD